MFPDLKYRIAFSHIRGIGAVRFKLLGERFGSYEEAWGADLRSLKEAGLPDSLVQAVLTERRKTDPDALVDAIKRKGIDVVCMDDPAYPALLKEIAAPPPILYVRGMREVLDRKAVAIVGTRMMTSYGKAVAAETAKAMAESGIVVVSGLARGVDGAAHASALASSGDTIAVLGSGVDVIYPADHSHLAAQIVRHGALVSDYPPGTQPERQNFPPRNRIISGLSVCTIVIEAGEKSGSLITARFAAEQGREVFVVPGNLRAPQSVGTNRLIRDGARSMLSIEDVLSYLETASPSGADRPFLPRQQQIAFEEPMEREIIELIQNEPLHVDEIARILKIPSGVLGAKMTLLELKGFIDQVAPNVYQKNLSLF